MARLHGESFTRGWSEAEFAKLLTDPRSALVHTPDGFALAQCVLDEAELLTIVVATEARGSGLGRSLLTTLLEKLGARGIARLHLEVAEDNAPARALYRSVGFTEVGRRKGYYPRKTGAIDALLLAKTL